MNDNLFPSYDEVHSWLGERTTVEQILAGSTDDEPVFDFEIENLKRLESRMIEGDELWEYCRPGVTRKTARGGQAGVALVRDGKVVRLLIDEFFEPSEDDLRRHYHEVKSWLTERVAIEEVEADIDGFGPLLDRENEEWVLLKDRMIEGDELWRYSSPGEAWEHLCGRAGVALVRDGEVFDEILILMN